MRDLPHHEPVLGAVGLGEAEEIVYRSIIERPGRTVEQVAEATALTQRDARRVLRILEEKGLVAPAPGTPQRFVPTPPDVALEALVIQRQGELEQVRATAASFAEQVKTRADIASPLEVIEVISGARALQQRVDQLHLQAEREICILDRPPYLREGNPVEKELLAAGIKFRTIYEQQTLSSPRQMDLLEEFVAAGEEARVIVGLPTKLGLIDAQIAMVALYPAVSGGLVIHPSPLVDALVALFEGLWQRAVPIGSVDDDARRDAELTDRESEILKLLASGQKDEVIARRLGVTTRTVQRSVSDVMRRLGVSTRYQAGLQAARRG